jgi:hypothetical protein
VSHTDKQRNRREPADLETSHLASKAKIEALKKPQLGSLPVTARGSRYAIYSLALAVAIFLWMLSIRAPLWLDETISFFLIKGGFREIMYRQGWPDVPVYSYILWLWTKIAGTSEVALRIPSVLAMLGAAYLLYRAAGRLFDRDVGIIAALVFCLHPIIVFASIDARPYAFGALAITSCILALVYLRENDANWLPAVFGFSAGCIAYFQLLFVVILPALAICFLALCMSGGKILWRRLTVGLAAFAVGFLPVIPGLEYILHTRGSHSFADAPRLADVRSVLVLGRGQAFILLATVVVSLATGRFDWKRHLERWHLLLCSTLALVPLLILYEVSVRTSIHVFVARYCLIAAPGVALCWAYVVSRVRSTALRVFFCVAVVAGVAYSSVTQALVNHHGYTWKYALETVEKNASVDDSPVLICSDIPESDDRPIPVGLAVKDNAMFAPLTYYKLSVPVVGLPRSLNEEAMRIGSQFVQEAAQRRQRFFALAFFPSYGTIDWIASKAASTHSVTEIGVFDDIEVEEFVPIAQGDSSR